MEFGDLSDNPFSTHAAPVRRKRRSIASAFKFLLLVAACLAVTLIIGSQSQRWLVHQLTRDFETLGADEKRDRLIQLSKLGRPAIDSLVQAIADEDVEVAHRAYEVLRQTQNEWMVLKHEEQFARHQTLIESLKSIAVQLPDDRTGWGTNLMQQTLMSTIDRRDDNSRKLYEDASKAIELLSISDRAGPSILSDEPLDPMAPRRLVVQSRPLPVASAEPMDDWTDWPPPTQVPADAAASIMSITEPALVETAGMAAMSGPGNSIQNTTPAKEVPPGASARPITGAPPITDTRGGIENASSSSPELYRSSGTKLQPVGVDEPVILRDVSQQDQPSESSSGQIRPVAYLVDSPMETLDDKSVVHWLASPHATLRDKAKLELIARGYNGTQIAIATELATGDVATRIELIDSIARSSEVDPRPWLLMMLEDESRDVRLRVISILATMKDLDVNQRLRMHLVDERDPTVASRIRRVLKLR